MLKHTQTYEIMTPESVGVSKSSLVMGKHSGRNAFRSKLKELGYDLGENSLEDASYVSMRWRTAKKIIYDEDIEALVDEEIATGADRIKVVSLTVIAGTSGPQSATLTLDEDGEHKTVQSTGNGPVDATFNAIKDLVPHDADFGTLPSARGDGGDRRPGRSVSAFAGGWPHGNVPVGGS